MLLAVEPIYNALISEYDRNWGHFFLAIIISFVNIVLIYLVGFRLTKNKLLNRFIDLLGQRLNLLQYHKLNLSR